MRSRLFWWCSVLLLIGCVDRGTADIVDIDHDGGDETEIVLPDPLLDDLSSPSIAVSASPDAFAEIAAWMGSGNTITLAKAMKVERPDVTLNLPANASVSYEFTGDAGLFTFAAPLPTVTASVLGFHVSPSLKSITLKPDGSGVASTGLGRRGFRWLADEESGGSAEAPAALPEVESGGSAEAPAALPEVWCYSQPGCPPCVRARLELAAAKDLPFRVVWKDEAAPEWLKSRPAFWWHVSANQPSQAEVQHTRQMTGWNGVKDVVARWKQSRDPKRFVRQNASAVTRPFVQPDRESSRAVARIQHHDGHNCPRCNREQYVIADQTGPAANSHIHRCGHCGTKWYHADQGVSSRSNGNKSFFGWRWN